MKIEKINIYLRLGFVILILGVFALGIAAKGCPWQKDDDDDDIISGSSNYPAQVTSPNPANGATNISFYQQLSWTAASGATSYDIYFGTTSPPPYQFNLSGTGFDPGPLLYNTTYYWRVNSKNSSGTTSGLVWNFQVENEPLPVQVTSPNPVSGTNDVPVTTSLSWDSANGATSYDVYFSTNSSPTYQASITSTIYSPGGITYTTTYYWRIDSKNTGGTTTGIIWNFQTEAEPVAPPDQVTSPNPVSGTNNVSINQQLSWGAATGAESYDVYFGIDNPPPSQTNTTNTSYNPGLLNYVTTYYWRIDSKNQVATTTGTVWSFQTITQPVWAQASAGDLHTIAIKTDKTLWAWGFNTAGQLGLGDRDNRNLPTKVGTDSNWETIICGYYHTLAIKTDGTLWGWGTNGYGQLGAGGVSSYRLLPGKVGTDTDWKTMDAYNHTLVIKTDGTLWACGYNAMGQLGLGYATTATPYGIASLTQVGADNIWKTVAAQHHASFGTKTDGTLWAWGTSYSSYSPIQVGVDTDWDTVASGPDFTLAIKTGGTIWFIYPGGPAQEGSDTDWQTADVGPHRLTLKTNKTLWAWGTNTYGQLGLGDTDDRSTPTQVGVVTIWQVIAAGGLHSIGLKTDGTLWSWGYNAYGQLGLGHEDNRNTPTQVGE